MASRPLTVPDNSEHVRKFRPYRGGFEAELFIVWLPVYEHDDGDVVPDVTLSFDLLRVTGVGQHDADVEHDFVSLVHGVHGMDTRHIVCMARVRKCMRYTKETICLFDFVFMLKQFFSYCCIGGKYQMML